MSHRVASLSTPLQYIPIATHHSLSAYGCVDSEDEVLMQVSHTTDAVLADGVTVFVNQHGVARPSESLLAYGDYRIEWRCQYAVGLQMPYKYGRHA